MNLKLPLMTILTSALVFSCASIGIAQQPNPAKPANGFKIITESKPIDGGEMTFVKLERMLITSSDYPDSPIELRADFSYVTRNNQLTILPIVSLGFTSRAPKTRFSFKSSITFAIDGERIKISSSVEAAERGEDIVTSFAEPGVEWIDVMLRQNTFSRIVNAKTVEIQVGTFKFYLNDEHLAGLREIARRMSQLQAQHNNSFNRSANSVAFIRETML
jgi:hypothetical protein